MLLTGCATTYDPTRHYDPNAIEKLGFIIQKEVAYFEIRESGDSPYLIDPVSFASLGTESVITASVINEILIKRSNIPIYAYLVKSEGEKIIVYSEYPNFDTGQCVKLFLSQRKDYPRIAPWGGC